MKFHHMKKFSTTNPDTVLCEWWASENDFYRVTKSLNENHWLAFFRVGEDDNGFSLVGPPVERRADAESLCVQHNAALP